MNSKKYKITCREETANNLSINNKNNFHKVLLTRNKIKIKIIKMPNLFLLVMANKLLNYRLDLVSSNNNKSNRKLSQKKFLIPKIK